MFVLVTYIKGYYFDFSTAWNSFADYVKTAPTFTTQSLSEFREAVVSLTDTNSFGFNMNTGDSILKVLKIIANAFGMLGNIVAFIPRCITAFLFLFVDMLSFLVGIVFAISDIVRNSWLPIGSNGFIQPDDWFSMITPLFLSL